MPIAYLCPVGGCGKLLSKPGRCPEHQEQQRVSRRRRQRQMGWDSANWRRVRKQALEQAGHQCQRCETTEDLTVHLPRGCDHKTATLDDVEAVLCRRHHGQVHAGQGGWAYRPPNPAA